MNALKVSLVKGGVVVLLVERDMSDDAPRRLLAWPRSSIE
jgi:hypothetical protein